jgi:SulP family sulfate permease
MSVVITAAITSLMKDPEITDLGESPAEAILPIIVATIIFGGLFQIILGSVGGGKLIKFIPYPVVAGFMNGIALIIFIDQLQPFLGVAKSTPLGSLFTGQEPVFMEAIIVGAVTIIATILAGRFIRVVPGALVGLAVGIATYFLIGATASPDLLKLQDNHLIIGTIPSALPMFDQALNFFDIAGEIPLAKWSHIIIPGLTLGMLAAIDTLLTSVIADVKTKTRHNSNKELIGQGIGNIGSAIFGGLPAAGSTTVTLINISSGGRSPISGITKSVMVLLIVLVFSQLVQWIPMAVLAGILMVTAVKIVDYKSFNLFKKKSGLENLIIVITVTAITVSIDLMMAVGIGLGIAILLFVKEQIGKTVIHRQYTARSVHSKKVRNREEMRLLEQKGQQIKIYELKGSLFFGTCDKLLTEIEHNLDHFCIILDLKRVTTIDLTGTQLIRQVADRVQQQGHHLLLAYLDIPGDPDKERLGNFMRDQGLIELIGADHIFPDTDYALEWAEDTLIQHSIEKSQHSKGKLTLHDLPIFKQLSPEQLQLVEKYVQPRTFKTSEVIFQEGDPGDGIYFILSGYVSVWAKMGKDIRATRLATFVQGVFFGEMSILDDKARSATVQAETDTKLLFMSKEDFQQITRDQPLLAAYILHAMARELSYRLRMSNSEVITLKE